MAKIDLPIGMMDQPKHVVERYLKMVKAGESPRLAEMLAVRKGPQLDTDTSYFASVPKVSELEKHNGKWYADKVRQQAKDAGIHITSDAIYNATIADERGAGDPGAWLLAGDGKDKFKNEIRKRGGACDTLGVQFGESAERADKEQARLEKLRKKVRERKTIERQKAAEKG